MRTELAGGFNLYVRVASVQAQLPVPPGDREGHFDDVFMQEAHGMRLQSTPQTALDIEPEGDHCESFQFNPNALPFVPGAPVLADMHDFVQDLHQVWTGEAFSWENEEPSCTFSTWHANHAAGFRHGTRPRNLRLQGDFITWEQRIRRLWQDEIDATAVLEFHLVQPTPPRLAHDVAGHIVVVQHPGDTLVTSLVTLIDNTLPAERDQLLRMAITMSERIHLEDILDVLGYTDDCLPSGSPKICRAWFFDERFRPNHPLPGRNGYGISIHVYPRVHPPSDVTLDQKLQQAVSA